MALLKITEKPIWDKYLNNFDLYDIYFDFDYITSIGDDGGSGIAEAVYFKDDTCEVFYPYLKRSLDMPWIPKEYNNYFDISSPFGAGGPLYKGTEDTFKKEWMAFVDKEKIISEFIRHHPINSPTSDPNAIHISDFVIIDFSKFPSIENLYENFRRNHKRNIISASEILTIKKISMAEFEPIYSAFVKERGLERQHEVFTHFINAEKMAPYIKLYGAYRGAKLNTVYFFLNYKNDIISSFFAGTSEYISGADALIFWTVIQEAYCDKCKIFSFGGGASIDDNIFKFKNGFSKQTAPYKISKIIHNQKIFDECKSATTKYFGNEQKLFPPYRHFS